MSCKITPCAISDHSAVSINWKVSSSRQRGSSHWHFNNSLLKNKDYTDSISIFWKQWQTQKSSFSNIHAWWDFGKSNIKQLTQMFGAKNAESKRQSFLLLNESIQQLQSLPHLSTDTQLALKEQRDALASLYKQEAQGALIRARFKYINEADTCSGFFFGMEQSTSRAKHISKIRLPSGEITENPSEINSHIHQFYTDLYCRTDTEEEASKRLLQNIPTLDPCDAEECDKPFSAEELDIAVGQLSHNKSPGLDGLTSEFYQHFWPIIKDDIFSLFNYSTFSGSLPVSCRRATITLLPKKGDLLDVANWRPVSLLNTDYKLFAKVLSNRLKNVIEQVVHSDQTYSVPGRSIYNNINIIRDSLMYSNSENIPLAILNLDQKKAFDNVDHEYLFKTMKAMGFGQIFISYVRLMYFNTESIVKVGGSLTSPFPFEKGIRQGCPLSGLLFSIAIEPLLHTLRNTLNDNGLQLPCNSNKNLVLSAYADDITIFITKNRSFDIVKGVYNLYSQASAARLNPDKSQGLWVGSWTCRPDQPLGFKWNNEGLVFLGVHLGNSNTYVQRNWSMCRERMEKCLSRWKRFSYSMSLKGRVLIANQLVASKLLHVFATLSPPETLIDELQEKLTHFVWAGKRHWLKKNILYSDQDRGGLGLTCLRARIFTSRFNLLRKFLSKPHDNPCFHFISYYFRQYRNLGLDFELFTTKIDPKFFPHLPTFQSELMRAWLKIDARVTTLPSDFHSFVNLPITSHFFVELDGDKGALTRRLATCGIKLVKDLLNVYTGTWHPPEFFTSSTTVRISTRCLSNDLKEFQHLISSLSKDFNIYGCSPHRNEIEPPTPHNITIMTDTDGLTTSTRTLYKCFNKTLNDLPDRISTHWHTTGHIDKNINIQWKNIHQLPTSKKEGDVQFKLLHNILPSLQVLRHIQPDFSPLCGWCGDTGSLTHLFITCPAIQTSLTLLHTLLQRLLPNLTLDFTLYWTLVPHVKGRPREIVRLSNYLIISLKSVIYWLYQKSLFSDPFIIWRSRIQHKIMSEFLFYKSQNNLHTFENKWSINNAIFTLVENKITWLI